jgi:acyl CoA:acetate/3-ketoacid CoA transferase alpha subunit
LRILTEGQGEYLRPDPDGYREWVRDHKSRALTPKLMGEKEAIDKFVRDGDYLVYECTYLQRGPSSLIREIIRQRKKDLWLCAKFTWVTAAMLVAAGCVSRMDVGFFLFGPIVGNAVREGRLKVYEYSNVVMTNRLMAGSMGIPFIALRSFGGTDGFKYSGAKIIEDPYTGQPTLIVPALNPDVALIHAQQADVYGNARIFGTGASDRESALASRKVILSAEEIIDTEEIRRDPGRTTIPYYAVDAVVHAPFGALPGAVQGYYGADLVHLMEIVAATLLGQMDPYLQKWVYGVNSHQEMLEKQMGVAKLLELQKRMKISEGYRP